MHVVVLLPLEFLGMFPSNKKITAFRATNNTLAKSEQKRELREIEPSNVKFAD